MVRSGLVLLACVLWAGSADAQTQANTGQIEGIVTDASGGVLPGAVVVIRHAETNQTRELVTDARGFYRAPLLQIGPYVVTVRLASFAPFERQGITLSTGQVLAVDVRLQPASLQESVSVVADADMIEGARITQSRAVNEIDIAELPNLSSSELNFAFLQPFVSGDPPREYEAPRIDAGGLNKRLNYQVDGFQNSTAQQKAFRVIIFSTAALQETQISSYGGTADSGRTGGPSVINNIIKSGTNEVRGQVRVQTSRRAFNALPYGSLPGNEPTGNTFVGNVGGPLRKDKTFYFVNYEASRRAFPQSLGFRTEASRANAARLGFTGAEVDVLPSNFNPQLWLVKLDWQASDSQRASLRANTFREFFAARDPGGTTVLSSSNGATFNEAAFAASWTSMLSSRAVNQVRAQVADRQSRRRPVVAPGPNTLPRTVVSGVATFGYPAGLSANREQIVEVSNDFSYATGAHQFKAGVNLVHSPLKFEDHLLPTFTFGGLTAAGGRGPVSAIDNYLNTIAGLIDPATGRPYTYTQLSMTFGERVLEYGMTYYGAYVQDEWRVRPDLTVTAGLRWETLEPPAADASSPHELSRQFRVDRDNIAPRAGFAWTPGRSSRMAVRGSYGLYFDAPQGNFYRDVLSQNGQRQFTATISGRSADAPVYPNVPVSAAALTTTRSSIRVMDPEYDWMSVQQASLAFERALTDDVLLTVSYAHTRARGIPVQINVNLAAPVGQLADGRPVYSAARIDPRFNNITMITPRGRAVYHGLGVNLNKRFGRGGPGIVRDLQFNTAWTWSHALDNAPEAGISGGSEFPQDSNHLEAEWGNALSDVRHTLNASLVYRPRARHWLLDNNQLSLLLFARTGNVFDVRAGTDLNRDSVNNDRPPFVGRNTGRGPASVQVDAKYARFIRFDGRQRLQVFIEGANVFNRVNPASSNGAVNRVFGTAATPVASFGTVISFREMRRVQIGARYDF